MTSSLLEVKQLKTIFSSENGDVPAVNDISFTVNPGETVAIVGESGCGKSATSLSIMGLITDPGKVIAGEVLFEGSDLLSLSKKKLNRYRGNKMSMIFQEPMTSLNPVFTIGNQISEVIRKHQRVDKETAIKKSIEMLERVGISNASKVIKQFPHQLSGGMRQRVMIAIALACMPKLLIADEPTTALDVTIQAQILDLIKHLSEQQNTGVLLITHDLGVVAEMADRVIVMYAGEIVEETTVAELFDNPKHPYTMGLLGSTPRLEVEQEMLEAIPGVVPDLTEMPSGCPFHPRCKYAIEACKLEKPALIEDFPDHFARCIRAKEGL
ncbi:ABC transporter ATP-binding protein [Amphibacillus cookii]|uniref:ABC transporter ATP-binding protein n=1 Tax=Amphibacillus cookii TaxID=767787 RepID=UPI0019565FC6|nr:ABC transporter ATP-binding protein [Amphibacillus cookii]MBM7542215.1 peptide/nickel transport system ATP-binding protein/oligopeptide transport system ATP-binding protein [Amphibacillus cookii]